MNGFEKRREQKKESIRCSAEQLFMKQGFQETSIAEIAAKAGVSQVTIYKYYGSKEKLQYHVIEHYMAEQLQGFIDVVDNNRPFLDKLNYFFSQKVDGFAAIHMEFVDKFISSDPEMAILMEKYEKELLPYMIRFIEQGREEGYFSKNLSMETMLFYINLFSSQAMQQLEQMPQGEQKRRVYNELLTVFLYGVTGKCL